MGGTGGAREGILPRFVILSGPPSVDSPGEVMTEKWVYFLKVHPREPKESAALAEAQEWSTRNTLASLDHTDPPVKPGLLGTWAASLSPSRAFPKWPQLPRGSAHFLEKT